MLTAGDSAVVDTTTCITWETNSFFEFKVPARQENYIIRGSLDGYEDGFLDYNLRHIARNNHFELPRLLLKKKQNVYKEVGLDGVVVTGTKVKISYRGDTIVYNASAFNLPEGSMLDGLIRQMPGAELKDNGDVYINGRKVDYLMLNGKAFFKGKNKVMLENLPYFTVQNIKVYDKSTKQSELLGFDVEKKDYVMDVYLKAEYNRGFLGNAETGVGTDNRYMARLFSLYYDDHSRVSIFGNTNNVNENRKPGGDGEWRPSDTPTGLVKTNMTGIHLSTEDQDKRWEENLDATLSWSDTDEESRTVSESFASNGNIFSNSWSANSQKDFRFDARNSFGLQRIGLYSGFSINYSNGHRDTQYKDSTMRDVLINQMQNLSYNRYRTLDLKGQLSWIKKFYWGDYVSLNMNGSLERQKPNEQFTMRETRFEQEGNRDHRNYYADTHHQSDEYQVVGCYMFQLPYNWTVGPQISFSQQRQELHNSNYRLDWLANVPANAPLNFLPSTREALQQVLDASNSDSQTKHIRNLKPSISVSHMTDQGYLGIELPLNIKNERMHFTDEVYDTVVTRTHTTFEPSVTYSHWGRNFRILSYVVKVSQPDFASLMPVDDTTNPLATHVNNPSLKSSINHQLEGNASWTTDSLNRTVSGGFSFSLNQRAWGTRTMYDPNTGAYTYVPDNINGNWTASLNGSFQQPVDRKRRLTFSEGVSAAYDHSVDFPIIYNDMTYADAERSTVHNIILSNHLRLAYQIDKLSVSLIGSIDYRLSTSSREDFQRINAFDFNYGLKLNYTIPWINMGVATDITMFSRRGYYSDLMNDDHLVWNAALTRSLLKNRLTLKMTAFDLLHQLSNTQYSVNAQGRTETWNNSISRYVMLSITYKLTRKQKN